MGTERVPAWSQARSDAPLAGVPHPVRAGYSRYYEELLVRTEALPATALVTANERIDFRGIFAAR